MRKNLTLTLVLIFLSGSCYGFDVFDQNRGKPPPPDRPVPVVKKPPPKDTPFKKSRKRPSRPVRSQPQRDFTLRGTSRIGKKRTAILKGPDNKDLVQRFENNQRTPIEGYEGYYLLGVKAREVQIEYPKGAPCRKSNEQKGIECDGEIAILSLVQGRALPPRRSARSRPPSRPPTSRSARNRFPGPQSRNRPERKVIPPSEVPPGMRVVHTPFGDRLVPNR